MCIDVKIKQEKFIQTMYECEKNDTTFSYCMLFNAGASVNK